MAIWCRMVATVTRLPRYARNDIVLRWWCFMPDIVNLFEVEPGQKVRLYGEATAEVVSNPKDGVWLFVRYLTSPEDPDQVGEEDMVFAQDVLELVFD